MDISRYIILKLFIYIFLFCSSECTLSQKNRKGQISTKQVQEQSILERGLVQEAVRWRHVVDQHSSYTAPSSPPNITTLAYVTPWNNHGYDIARLQSARFALISPVWLQLRRAQPTGGRAWQVTGLQDVDQDWMEDVKKSSGGTNTKMVPRIVFEGWSVDHFQALVDSPPLRQTLAQDLVAVIEEHNFDGLVLEVWSQLPARRLLSSMPAAIADISDSIRGAGYTVVLVIPPAVHQSDSPGMFQASQFQALAPHVDYFSLMTYDFSSLQNPGPNSPLWWMRQCVEALVPDQGSPHRGQLLLGLNLYGLDHSVTGGSHIVGRQYVETLARHKPKMQYDDKSVEHFFEYKSSEGRHTVFYPSLYSLHRRVQLAQHLGTGLSLWEIGQGLDYFYDLF